MARTAKTPVALTPVGILGGFLPDLSTACRSGSFGNKFERGGDVTLPAERDPEPP